MQLLGYILYACSVCAPVDGSVLVVPNKLLIVLSSNPRLHDHSTYMYIATLVYANSYYHIHVDVQHIQWLTNLHVIVCNCIDGHLLELTLCTIENC